jgi:broad specificity phosphatase PhoE
MKLYFVRHGESIANLLREFSNRGFKHGLTERGIEQAEALAQNLRGVPFSQVYASPIKRAYQTAEIMSEALGIPLEVTDALREFDCGVLEGKSDPESWALFDRVFEQWQQGQWEERIPKGESHLQIQARFIPFINEIIQNPEGENILLVGHGGTYRCMFPLIFANLAIESIRDLEIQHTMPIIGETRGDRFICTRWGERNMEDDQTKP